MLPDKFTVRVYGLWVERGQILLSHERIAGGVFTKFPGGGMEFGEGPVQCLEREFFEELGVDILVQSHVYTTNFYIQSAFNPHYQVVGVYYLVGGRVQGISTEAPHPDEVFIHGQVFQWVSLKELSPANLSFEADRAALLALKSQLGISDPI